jgi:hypothetical protein
MFISMILSLFMSYFNFSSENTNKKFREEQIRLLSLHK